MTPNTVSRCSPDLTWFSELTTVVKFLGLKMTEEEVQALFDEFDEDKSGSIEFDEFLILISKKASQFTLLTRYKEEKLLASFAQLAVLSSVFFQLILWNSQFLKGKLQLQVQQWNCKCNREIVMFLLLGLYNEWLFLNPPSPISPL